MGRRTSSVSPHKANSALFSTISIISRMIPLLLFFLFSASALARSPVGSFSNAYGPRFHRSEVVTLQRAAASEAVHRWNQAAIDATGLDHTPVAPGENRVFGEQFGPGSSSRAMAIVRVGIFNV